MNMQTRLPAAPPRPRAPRHRAGDDMWATAVAEARVARDLEQRVARIRGYAARFERRLTTAAAGLGVALLIWMVFVAGPTIVRDARATPAATGFVAR